MKGYFICFFKKLFFNVNILILILQMTLQEENLRHNLSEIILTIEGTGKQQILSNSFNILPTKVEGDCYLMNDKKYVECQKNENIVNIFFDKEINSAEKMFTDLKNQGEGGDSNCRHCAQVRIKHGNRLLSLQGTRSLEEELQQVELPCIARNAHKIQIF